MVEEQERRKKAITGEWKRMITGIMGPKFERLDSNKVSTNLPLEEDMEQLYGLKYDDVFAENEKHIVNCIHNPPLKQNVATLCINQFALQY